MPRVVLHIDCDAFFLQVHYACDPAAQGLRGLPVALYQYQDVFCVSHEARALGVRKHSSPKEALGLLAPAGGHLLHAFMRQYPGPRVWYARYAQFGRRVADYIRRIVGGTGVVERSSVDEVYADVSRRCDGDLEAGVALAEEVCPFQPSVPGPTGSHGPVVKWGTAGSEMAGHMCLSIPRGRACLLEDLLPLFGRPFYGGFRGFGRVQAGSKWAKIPCLGIPSTLVPEWPVCKASWDLWRATLCHDGLTPAYKSSLDRLWPRYGWALCAAPGSRLTVWHTLMVVRLLPL